MRYFDITPPVSPRLAVFPGDVPYSQDVSMAFERGDHLMLSSITTTLHIGAHADAPNHYHADGAAIAERSLEPYLGPCQVLHVACADGARIRVEDLGATAIEAPRVLFRTDSFPDPERWRDGFNSLSPELIEHLVARGVRLVGIDTPSVDPHDSKDLPSHQALYRHDLSVLEGIVLSAVEPGLYTLIALPLRLAGADASPVRAILLPAGWSPGT